jgi:hypothetical protein
LDPLRGLEEAFLEQWEAKFQQAKRPDADEDLKAIVPYCLEFLDILKLLQMLIDSDITLHGKIYSKVTLNRFLGGTLHEAWNAILLALEDSKFWGPRVLKFTRHRVDEAELAPEVEAEMNKLKQASKDNSEACINDSIELALKAESLCRDNGIVTFWQAISDCMHAYWAEVQTIVGENDLPKIREVDFFLNQAIQKMRGPDGDFQTRLLELRGQATNVLQRLSKVDSANKLELALDAYVADQSVAKFEALKVIIFGCSEKIGAQHIHDKILAAMAAARDCMFKKFVGMTPNTIKEPEWYAHLKVVREVCSVMSKQLFNLIGNVEAADSIEKEWHTTIAAKLSVYLGMADLLKLSENAEEQFEADDGVDIFESLVADRHTDKKEQWKCRLPFKEGEDWSHNSAKEMFPTFNVLAEFCKPYDDKVDAILSCFQNAAMKGPIEDASKLAEELAMKCGGMEDGSDYKGDHHSDESATYEMVLEAAMGTVFDNAKRGITRKLGTLKDSGQSAVKRVTSDASKFHFDLTSHGSWEAIVQTIQDSCYRVDTTLSECKVMHNITRDKRTALSARQDNVNKVVLQTQSTNNQGVSSLTIHKAIKTKGHEFLRG